MGSRTTIVVMFGSRHLEGLAQRLGDQPRVVAKARGRVRHVELRFAQRLAVVARLQCGELFRVRSMASASLKR